MPLIERGPKSSFEKDYLIGPENNSSKIEKTEEQENMPPLPLNGLLYPVDLDDKRVIEAFKFVVEKVIKGAGGAPVKIETTYVEDPFLRRLFPRLIFSFETNHLTA